MRCFVETALRGEALSLLIVGAGFGRTGSDSMRAALNMLGFGPCHHMHEVRPSEAQIEIWYRIAMGETPDWEAVFKGFRSSLDWPSVAFWREILDANPGAKLLLTRRPVEAWFKSFSGTILPILLELEQIPEDKRSHEVQMLLAIVRDRCFGGNVHDEGHMKAVYEAYNAEVEAAVPEGRRLTFTAGDGWEPLCAWLGVAVPEEPFPFGNTTAEFQAAVERERAARRS